MDKSDLHIQRHCGFTFFLLSSYTPHLPLLPVGTYCHGRQICDDCKLKHMGCIKSPRRGPQHYYPTVCSTQVFRGQKTPHLIFVIEARFGGPESLLTRNWEIVYKSTSSLKVVSPARLIHLSFCSASLIIIASVALLCCRLSQCRRWILKESLSRAISFHRPSAQGSNFTAIGINRYNVLFFAYPRTVFLEFVKHPLLLIPR